MELCSVEWSDQIYELKDFIESFNLPQIVKVRDGYFDLNEINTLSMDQILTFHSLKTSRTIRAVSENGQELTIPLNVEVKVERLGNKRPKVYRSVQQLSEDFPKLVVSLNEHPWLGIRANDILQLEAVTTIESQQFLCCSFVNRAAEKNAQIPLQYTAIFQVMEENESFWLKELEDRCELPITIKVVKDDASCKQTEQSTQLATLGKITIKETFDDRSIIASIKYGEITSVVQVPIDLEITVLAAKGAAERDSRYVGVCEMVHNRAKLEQLEQHDLDRIKMADEEDTVDSIYEYIDVTQYSKPKLPESTEKTEYSQQKPQESIDKTEYSKLKPPESIEKTEYSQPKPPVPPKSKQDSPRPNSPASSVQPSEDNLFDAIPDNLETLTAEGVANCLRLLNMDAYVEKFIEEQIDGSMLADLTIDMLDESLEVHNKLHQKKLMKLIKGWRPK